MSETIRIDVERFFTKYTPDPSDPAKMIGVDYCAYGPFGALDRSKTVERVSRLSAVQADGESDNLAVQMARIRWECIKPKYDAWKEGREIPATGTPLAAWNLLQQEDADILRTHRIFTVEDVAALSDAHLQRIAIPNGRSIVQQAKLFLQSADTNRASAEMTRMAEENAALRAEMDEIKAMLLKEAEDDDVGEGAIPAPRRGRPTNAEIAARQGEAA